MASKVAVSYTHRKIKGIAYPVKYDTILERHIPVTKTGEAINERTGKRMSVYPFTMPVERLQKSTGLTLMPGSLKALKKRGIAVPENIFAEEHKKRR